MRRKDREITDFSEMIGVMRRCDVCRLALNGEEGYPYILPLNFGMEETDGRVTLYFHGAKEGKKYELIRKNSKASFEMDCSHRLILSEKEDGCQCTMEYESVIGQGKIEILPDAEKKKVLDLLMKQYYPDRTEGFVFRPEVVAMTEVFGLKVEHMTGKKRVVGIESKKSYFIPDELGKRGLYPVNLINEGTEKSSTDDIEKRE